MLRTLLVPVDGSELAERALPYAVRVALASGGQLVLVRVGRHAEVGEVTAYLAEVAAKTATRVAVQTLAAFGDPASEIVDTAKRVGADEIVMATHGRTGPAHLLCGSVAEAVLAHSPVPVLIVYARPNGIVRPPFEPVSARILVPLDGSAFAEAALPIALDVLGTAGELVLVCVVNPPEQVELDERGRVVAFLDEQEAAFRSDALDYLQRVASTLKQGDPNLHVACEVRLGDAATGIVVSQIDRGVDLVVMATHGRTGLARSVLGSVAGAVLRSGTTPVLLVRPNGLADTEHASTAKGPGFIVA
jgi:nucleotide-binding universal stress UspA family protein